MNLFKYHFYSAVYLSCEGEGIIKEISADFVSERIVFDDSTNLEIRPHKMTFNNQGTVLLLHTVISQAKAPCKKARI